MAGALAVEQIQERVLRDKVVPAQARPVRGLRLREWVVHQEQVNPLRGKAVGQVRADESRGACDGNHPDHSLKNRSYGM